MNIEDFKPRQTAIMEVHTYGQPFSREVTVAKVGRKYVTICEERGARFFLNNDTDSCLTQDVDAGAPNYLFLSKQAYDDYVESIELFRWLSHRFTYTRKRLPLETMRRIKEIIEESEYGGSSNG